jgi:hypothetical protein
VQSETAQIIGPDVIYKKKKNKTFDFRFRPGDIKMLHRNRATSVRYERVLACSFVFIVHTSGAFPFFRFGFKGHPPFAFVRKTTDICKGTARKDLTTSPTRIGVTWKFIRGGGQKYNYISNKEGIRD